jgi:hypothetical protein
MNEALLRWLALSLPIRLACLIVASALLLALAWWVFCGHWSSGTMC